MSARKKFSGAALLLVLWAITVVSFAVLWAANAATGLTSSATTVAADSVDSRMMRSLRAGGGVRGCTF